MTDPRRCGRKTRSGGNCKRLALNGADVCEMHGGAAPQVKAAAKRRLDTEKASTLAHQLGVPIETSPQQALLDEVHRCAGMVAYYADRVREVADEDPANLVWGTTKEKTGGDDFGTTKEAAPNVWLQLWNTERDRLVKASTAAIRAGIEERRVRLAEEQGALIATAIRRILEQLNLTPDQYALVGEVVPAELRALTAA